MSKRLSDDEKRFFTDQITMLKGENERLTKYIENQKDSLQDCEAENEALIKAIRHEHTLDGENQCLKAKSGVRCWICALLTGKDEYIDCPEAIGKPRWCKCHGFQYPPSEERMNDDS